MKVSWKGHAPLIAVACVAFGTFSNSLYCGFVWDDRAAILTNQDIRTDGSTTIWDLFYHDFWGTMLTSAGSHKSFRPITVLTFRLNYALGGYQPWGYHFVNVVLHVAASVLVVICGRRVCEYHMNALSLSRTPVLAGILFAAHPIHCDSVASVVGRADVLCTLISLVAFLIYHSAIQESRTNWLLYVISLALVVLATLSKELGITTLGILVILELCHASHHGIQTHFHSSLIRVGFLVAFGALFIIARVWLNGEDVLYKWTEMENDISLLPFGLPKILTTAHTHAWYLYKIAWPEYLCYDYGYKTIPIIEDVSDPRNGLTLAAYAAVLWLIWRSVRDLYHKASPLLLMTAFGVFPFVPAANVFFPVGTIVAERLLYYPSVGVCFLVGYVIDTAISASSSRMQQTLLLQFGALVACAALRSVRRNGDWTDETTLFESSILVAPWSTKVLSNLSKVLLNTHPSRAAAYLDRSLSILPGYAVGYLNLGLAYVNLGKPLHAMDSLLQAIDINHSLGAYAYLGKYAYEFYYDKQHDKFPLPGGTTHALSIAKKLLDHTLENGHNLPVIFLTRGLIEYHARNFAEAIPYFERTMQENARVLARGYDLEEEVAPCSVYETALDQGLTCLELYNNAAIRFKEMGQTDRAAQLYDEAVREYPNHGGLLANAGFFAEQRGNPLEAINLYQRALHADPTNPQIQANFNNLRIKLATAEAVYGEEPMPMEAWHVGI
ncbi:hypothetical protein AeMF1_008857 [Aphanomyces euteiches]|nr:hypothetical protein AeMF1_008857 [Aphanomyces euteiches]KAH9194161.1 hypothetical protein AeNC1_003856 [Aphanomyces euteiches]